MNERAKLLNKINMYSFAMWELHIYLDTHTNDEKAKAMHNDYLAKYRAAANEFEKLYGPLNMCNVNENSMADWIDNPWPWDPEAN